MHFISLHFGCFKIRCNAAGGLNFTWLFMGSNVKNEKGRKSFKKKKTFKSKNIKLIRFYVFLHAHHWNSKLSTSLPLDGFYHLKLFQIWSPITFLQTSVHFIGMVWDILMQQLWDKCKKMHGFIIRSKMIVCDGRIYWLNSYYYYYLYY